MKRQKILITGGKGYIASSIYNAINDIYEITSISRDDFDLIDRKAVDAFFNKKHFDVVIHCAAVGGSRLKKDWDDVLDINLQMYYNLLANKGHYNRFINFGSGADDTTPYGLSKRVISESMYPNHPNFYNLNIWGVFDENELDTRFIKANLLRYIKNEPMLIYEDKIMDFFYIKDLITLVEHTIEYEYPYNVVNCTYNKKHSLLEIARFINELNTYKVPIYVDMTRDGIRRDYKSPFGVPSCYDKLIGLEQGIYNTYQKLKK